LKENETFAYDSSYEKIAMFGGEKVFEECSRMF
jgi:hypothetical protein